MFWLLHLLFSFLSSFFFAVIFDAPKRLFVSAGIVGSCGWMVFEVLNYHYSMNAIYASMFGSLILGIVSHLMARFHKEPVIIFMVPGIIPLVPGGVAFDATKNLIILNYGKAMNLMFEVTLVAGAIAVGLLFADQLSKFLISKPKRKSHDKRPV
ncbi:threonine/serine exporter family protein [Staphylococcus massiliensis]|uniref:Threonine/Serine exporter ThrE domain-containing protein n=1 Tax=Staphylococcus massiliensis S46 TaxID=1229783 RepID=K9ATV6_9STAP|nr:threonine/serine exporter family protein [Staphylococcus massiliensis]EKU46037.1 hypothetical protein C273_10262 [Staphylococcus massiliensis S46]MCG3400305.1 threonine/serine exporter family protein [Staphylococcus massiliensis]MCG3412403.1 threonine/serine exporter family protein [Staphylococcus massiliensis]POA01441.1 threonine/serine exporter [Staphylococcus massiliensis CCUG 55927]